MGDILLICEQENGQIKKYSKELAYKASEMAGQLGCDLHALVLGPSAKDDAASLGGFGVKKAFVATNRGLDDYNADLYVNAAEKVIQDENLSIILGTASPTGKELLARLAARFNSGMATECIDFEVKDSEVIFRRPIYAGKAWVDVKISSGMKFATARPNVFEIGEPKGGAAEVVVTADVEIGENRVILKEKVQSEAKQVDLVEANVIVSGGRAMGSGDKYQILRDLAGVLNASVGASRAAVDAGYITHDHQVGQTGKTVNPTLYIACGISGAIQHLAGMRTSKVIVAINKDPEAPIFSKADFGIVGDLFKVVPVLTEKLKKVMSE